MPSAVVLTSRPASPSSSPGRAAACADTPAPKRSASSTARATVRLTTRMSRKAALLQRLDHGPRGAARAKHHRGSCRSPSPAHARRDWRQTPAASVLPPQSTPSSNHSVLTAPIFSAASSRRAAAANAASLCGIVTLPPAKPFSPERREEARRNPQARRRSPRSCRRCRISPASSRGSSASANARSGGRRRRLFSCLPQPSIAPSSRSACKHGQQRQADDGEIVALDLLEQLDALALDLVGADARSTPCRRPAPDAGR